MVEPTYKFEDLPEEVVVDGKRYIRKDIGHNKFVEALQKELDGDKVHPREARKSLNNLTSMFIGMHICMMEQPWNHTNQINETYNEMCREIKALGEVLLKGIQRPDVLDEDNYMEVE